MGEPIGLIAGGGRLPILEAEGIRAAGRQVACVGLADQYDPELPACCDLFAEAGLVRLGRWIRLLRGWSVREAVMVGAVRKTRMYDPLRVVRQIPDWRAAWLFFRVLRQDRRDQTLLGTLADELGKAGIELIDTTRYIQGHLAEPGVLTRRVPSPRQWQDIRFAWPILLRLNELDVGQSMAVKDADVIAVEAIEGTDAMIERASALCRSGGWTMLKGALPAKDLRFDVPTVGVRTVENLASGGGRCLALTAGRVIIVEREKVIEAADRAGVVIVGVPEQGPGAL